MSIETALRAHLIAAAGVTALVGTRIYPQAAPTGAALPYIVYHRISGPRDHHQGGPSGLAMPRFQLDCYAATYLAAGTLADAVRPVLDGFRGTLGSGAQTATVRAAWIDNDIDGYEAPEDASQFGTPRRVLDFIINHTE